MFGRKPQPKTTDATTPGQAEQQGRKAWKELGDRAYCPYLIEHGSQDGLRTAWWRGFADERTKSRVKCMRDSGREEECAGK